MISQLLKIMNLKSVLWKIKNISFIKKVTFLFSGLLISNIISLLAFFVAAQLYNVETLGNYYIFISLGTVLNVLATLGYTHCLPVVKDDEIRQMFFSIFLAATVILILISPVISYFYDFSFLLIVFCLSQVYTSLTQQLLIKDQLIKKLNFINIGTSLSNLLFSVTCFFLFGDNLFYLILFTTTSSVLVNILVHFNYIKYYSFFNKNSFSYNLLKKYDNFLKFIGPGLILHTIAYQIPTLVSGTFFTPALSAYYNMAYKLVYLPASLISASISQVFIGRLSMLHRDNDDIFKGIEKLFLTMIALAIIFVMSAFFLLPQAVVFLFGDKWLNSIDISFALLPLVFSLISISPLSNIFQFTNNQKTVFGLHLYSLFVSLTSFTTGIYLDNFTVGLYIFSISMLGIYIILALKIKMIVTNYRTAKLIN